MQRWVRRCFYGFISIALTYIILSGILSKVTGGRHKDPIFDLENDDWVASSGSWSDRAICRWFGLCGSFHLFHRPDWTRRPEDDTLVHPIEDSTAYWFSGQPDEWCHEERELREIPQYVFDHAPYVHLYSKERFWPTDVAEHVKHSSPHLNYTEISTDYSNGSTSLLELNNVEGGLQGRNVYLHSNDDVTQLPHWVCGVGNIPTTTEKLLDDEHTPNSSGDVLSKPPLRYHQELRRRALESSVDTTKHQAARTGKSSAPAMLVVVPKDDGIIDAFWFFFYSFNEGQKVFNIRFGDHVGDWEHTLVRFKNGKPQYVSLSEHHFGAAYAWDALEKYLPDENGSMVGTWSNETVAEIAKRPVVYSADGSHAMYATPGSHPYILPGGFLHDETDRGPLWDPLQNVHSYTYDMQTIRSSTRNPKSPTDWFEYLGHWGDKYYPLSDPRQYRFAGQYHFMNGPYGPRYKNIGRKEVCQSMEKCDIKHRAGSDGARRLPPTTVHADVSSSRIKRSKYY